jgi:hypothetical protein
MTTTADLACATPVLSFMQHRLVLALEQRARYKYVKPRVLPHGEGYRVESPCCSRNVDPSGGVIDIALLLPPGGQAPDALPPATAQGWNLFSRNHVADRWQWQAANPRLADLLDQLCVDAQRVFWP